LTDQVRAAVHGRRPR